MGHKYHSWRALSSKEPRSHEELINLLQINRQFYAVDKLDYGDYGLEEAVSVIEKAISENRRIALYADYDVDGTMACVSWIWFLKAISYLNYTYYIPCRFSEGYGLNETAVRYLVEEQNAEVVITMDTGITANAEAKFCRSRGVAFVCTDHHIIQPEKMPDCTILNPKLHPDEKYQQLCGCGITFVLLRKLAQKMNLAIDIWNDLLALTGMATICDVVPLNNVNHRLAQLGIQALVRSNRLVLKRLREAAAGGQSVNEQDIGFRLGPRINAVGRLEHADLVIKAFIEEDPELLIEKMNECNEKRKAIQQIIVNEACDKADSLSESPILFLGGPWHQGVVGIAASKIAEKYWKPTWLFHRDDAVCKGSARSIPGFDVTEAMQESSALFSRFGGHKAAGGYSFPAYNEEKIRERLHAWAKDIKIKNPLLWNSSINYDFYLPSALISLELFNMLAMLKPFGHGFEEPVFRIDAHFREIRFYNDKASGLAKHTAIFIDSKPGKVIKIMFFNQVYTELQRITKASFLVTLSLSYFRGIPSLSLLGRDWDYLDGTAD